MNDLTTQSPPPFNGSALRIELAKMLGLVAPITMSADQCTLWLASAEDALKDIRVGEVAAISMEVRRTVTRPSQIVPEIAKLVAEHRSRQSRLREYDRPALTGPPVKRHIADRDRKDFTADDWAELNRHLERIGATKRYRSDGTRYDAPVDTRRMAETGNTDSVRSTGSAVGEAEAHESGNSA